MAQTLRLLGFGRLLSQLTQGRLQGGNSSKSGTNSSMYLASPPAAAQAVAAAAAVTSSMHGDAHLAASECLIQAGHKRKQQNGTWCATLMPNTPVAVASHASCVAPEVPEMVRFTLS